MTKKIAIFSDGTGNSSAKAQKTNVWRVYKALDLSATSNQVAFYDDGVGTSSFRPVAVLGGGFGFGLARNVRQIYRFVCETYEPGDEIYGFGFSRGAFTMRVVAAFIAHQGIIKLDTADGERDLKRKIRAAYRTFRLDSFGNSGLSRILRPLRDGLISLNDLIHRNEKYKPDAQSNQGYYENPEDGPPLIKFLGVWDTVDAYGLPIDEMTRAWDRVVWPLSTKDRDLSSRVERACHALALDEQRQSFEPMLWNEAKEPKVDNIKDERVTQIWFSGVHSNVGGGYPDDALSLVPLCWIMDESGLKYRAEEYLRLWQMANTNGPLNDSRRGIGTFYRYQPRNLKRLCNEEKPGLWNWLKSWFTHADLNEVKVEPPKIHHTVFERLQTSGDAYAPINLPASYAVVQADGTILRTKGSSAQKNGDTKLDGGDTLKTNGRILSKSGVELVCFTRDSNRKPSECKYLVPEDQVAAAVRQARQELVWNKVWLRRLVYGLTVGVTGVFFAFPFAVAMLPEGSDIFGAIDSLRDLLDRVLGTLSSEVRGLPEVVVGLPGVGFAPGFFIRYTEYPYIFFILLLVIGLLIVWGFYLKAAIDDQMRANWSHVAKTTNMAPTEAVGFKQILARTRGSAIYEILGRRVPRYAGELMAIVFFGAFILAVVSRLSFIVLDGAGLVCAATAADKLSVPGGGGEKFTFPGNDACHATGIRLEQGKHYLIEMKLNDRWRDGNAPGIKSDIYGWQDAKGYMSLFTPLRRHLLVDWYQPIARINDKLFDRYPLLAGESIPEKRGATCLHKKIRARDTGELYLYLNDAVLFTPDLNLEFYSNNQGSAEVRVTLLQNGGDTAPVPLCKREGGVNTNTE